MSYDDADMGSMCDTRFLYFFEICQIKVRSFQRPFLKGAKYMYKYLCTRTFINILQQVGKSSIRFCWIASVLQKKHIYRSDQR